MQFIINNKKILWAGGVVVLVLLVSLSLLAKKKFFGKNNGQVLGMEKQAEILAVQIETLGGDLEEGVGDLGISWPGEIVSLGDVAVQPQREGTIMEWKVNIGQRVVKGQVLGRLSAPPTTPEFASMLAEKAESLAKAKNQTKAFEAFAEKNKDQLKVLQEALEKNEVQGEKSKSVVAIKTLLEQVKTVAEVKKSKARIKIEQGVVNTFSNITNSSADPLTLYKSNGSYFPIYFKSSVGISNLTSRQEYTETLFKLLVGLRDLNALPQNLAREHFKAVLNVVSASYAGNEFTLEDMKELRESAVEAQSSVIEALEEYEDARLDIANMEKELTMAEIEYAEKYKEISEKIAELDKEVQMVQGEQMAEAVAYNVISGALTGSLNIIAPKSGIVSVIHKKNGDFVEPGMPLAIVNSGEKSERFVRFSIPSNLMTPEIGAILKMVRPSYPQDIKNVQIIGVGNALNENGSFVADARFVDDVDWPVGVSVRVIPSPDLISNFFVPLSAIWWNDDAEANIWLVTEENRIRPRQIKLGRAMGDGMEVISGLAKGEKFVVKNLPNLQTGQSIADIKPESLQESGGSTSDGHGHGHDE